MVAGLSKRLNTEGADGAEYFGGRVVVEARRLRRPMADRCALLNGSLSMTSRHGCPEPDAGSPTPRFSHALALAANENAGHGVGGLAGFRKGRIWAMPLGMVDVVAGGPSFAVAALPASAAV